MTLLTNTDIRNILSSDPSEEDKSKLIITPLDENCITPVGYDLRIGHRYVVNGEEKSLSENQELRISPRNIALINTLEEVFMPKNKTLSGMINSKVSLSCKGLSNISTTVDADWRGTLLIAVHNNSNKDISLKFGESFCTILFFENKSPAKEGKYAKPHGRTDILTETFKKNTKNTPAFLSLLINAIPPTLAVLTLYLALELFKDDKTLVTATVAVGIFVAGYITKFTDQIINYLGKK